MCDARRSPIAWRSRVGCEVGRAAAQVDVIGKHSDDGLVRRRAVAWATREWALATRRLFLPRAVYDERISFAAEIPSTYIVATGLSGTQPGRDSDFLATSWRLGRLDLAF
jgi:hypothetical protein